MLNFPCCCLSQLKNYSPVLKYFQWCCRALTLLGQFCLPWATTTRWGSCVPWKGRSWDHAEAKTFLWIVFLTQDANFVLLPRKFLLPEWDALLLLAPLNSKISPMHLSGHEIPAQAPTRALVTTIWQHWFCKQSLNQANSALGARCRMTRTGRKGGKAFLCFLKSHLKCNLTSADLVQSKKQMPLKT